MDGTRIRRSRHDLETAKLPGSKRLIRRETSLIESWLAEGEYSSVSTSHQREKPQELVTVGFAGNLELHLVCSRKHSLYADTSIPAKSKGRTMGSLMDGTIISILTSFGTSRKHTLFSN